MGLDPINPSGGISVLHFSVAGMMVQCLVAKHMFYVHVLNMKDLWLDRVVVFHWVVIALVNGCPNQSQIGSDQENQTQVLCCKLNFL